MQSTSKLPKQILFDLRKKSPKSRKKKLQKNPSQKLMDCPKISTEVTPPEVTSPEVASPEVTPSAIFFRILYTGPSTVTSKMFTSWKACVGSNTSKGRAELILSRVQRSLSLTCIRSSRLHRRQEHKLLVEDPDTEVHSHMMLPVVTISEEDKEYPKKKVNHDIVQKRVKKELDGALADDEQRSFSDIAGRPDEKEWLEACEKGNQSHATMGSIVPIHRSKLPPGGASARVAKMKCIFKKKRDGRRKVRDVFGGHTQSIRLVDDASSPTVNPITFFTVLILVASTGWDYCTLDIETAYLNAVLPPDQRLFAELPDWPPASW